MTDRQQSISRKGFEELLVSYELDINGADEKLADQFGLYNTWYLPNRLILNAFIPSEYGVIRGEQFVASMERGDA